MITAAGLTCMLSSVLTICGYPQRADAKPFEPEQVYVSIAGIACPTEAEFLEIVQHAGRGEITLAEQMMRGGGGDCINFPANIRIRVLHTDPTVFAGHNVIEFNPDDHPEYDGAWGSDQLLGKRWK